MEKLKSRKLFVGVLSALLIIVNDVLGKPVSEDAVYSAIAVLGSYIIGQGIADHSKQSSVNEFNSTGEHDDEPVWNDDIQNLMED